MVKGSYATEYADASVYEPYSHGHVSCSLNRAGLKIFTWFLRSSHETEKRQCTCRKVNDSSKSFKMNTFFSKSFSHMKQIYVPGHFKSHR